jgi:hypothetical protein
MAILFVLLIIAVSLSLIVGIVSAIALRKKQKKESELGIFHHPSNFKKAPVEWVQKPKDNDSDQTTKKL